MTIDCNDLLQEVNHTRGFRLYEDEGFYIIVYDRRAIKIFSIAQYTLRVINRYCSLYPLAKATS